MTSTRQQSLWLICGNRNYSSWSLRAWLCLRKAGENPEVTVLPMDTAEFEEQIGALSPTRRVPVLWIGDESIWDSLAIAETVNERFADGSLWPDDGVLRAFARSICAEMHSSFGALREALPMNCRAQRRRVPVTREVQADIDRVAAIWDQARERSGSDSGWLLGRFSIADAMFAPVAVRFAAYALDLPQGTRSYVQHWLNDKDLQSWMAAARQESWRIEHEEVGEESQ